MLWVGLCTPLLIRRVGSLWLVLLGLLSVFACAVGRSSSLLGFGRRLSLMLVILSFLPRHGLVLLGSVATLWFACLWRVSSVLVKLPTLVLSGLLGFPI